MIELTNIEKRFGDIVVLKDINITIPEGSVTALVGPSGAARARCCGASTCWKSRPPARSASAGRR